MQKYSFKLAFTNHAHSGSIRSLTRIGKFVASGGADEAIRLINMSTRHEHGHLQQQSGTVFIFFNLDVNFELDNCVIFPSMFLLKIEKGFNFV